MKRTATLAVAAFLLATALSFAGQAKPAAPAAGQKTPPAAPATKATAPQTPAAQAPTPVTPPGDYVIGIGDVLIITYWEEPAMSTDSAVVRPDGKITLPLLNDVDALNLRPEQLQVKLTELSSKQAGLKEPRVSVNVRQINSRKVFISGGIQKPGPYDLVIPMTVMQLISVAGGLKDFVNGKDILILRDEGGKPRSIKFNYKEVVEGKNLGQNIPLRPGDTIVVPD